MSANDNQINVLTCTFLAKNYLNGLPKDIKDQVEGDIIGWFNEAMTTFKSDPDMFNKISIYVDAKIQNKIKGNKNL